jgi:mannosyltransferase OCH1-like enzyme
MLNFIKNNYKNRIPPDIIKTKNIIKKNIIKKNIIKENIIKENIIKENIIKENIIKENIIKENIIKENIIKENIITKIPLNIFQTWHSHILPVSMSNAITSIKLLNPEFKHYLYNDDQCRNFIQTNFHTDVLFAFDNLIPGAYKADLWRYCILYLNGGIYLDVKFIPYKNFKFIKLVNDEHWVLDRDKAGIYNALIVCKKGNKLLLSAINQIVENVKNKYYGATPLVPTGPKLLIKYFTEKEISNLDMDHTTKGSTKFINYNKQPILQGYEEYFYESRTYSITRHYYEAWKKKEIYKEPPLKVSPTEVDVPRYTENLPKKIKEGNDLLKIKTAEFSFELYDDIIPLKVYQTWYTKKLPEKMKERNDLLKIQNPEFSFELYDNDDCRNFIQTNFHTDVLFAFDNLMPGAYKADLWRYCILYLNGGIYIDIKLTCENGFKLIELVNDEHFVKDRIKPLSIYTTIMVCKKGNKLLIDGIQKIVENVKNKYYGTNPLEPTGPLMLGKIILQNKYDVNIDMLHHQNGGHIVYNNNFVLSTDYIGYNDDKNNLYEKINIKRYNLMWQENNIYL